MTHLSRIPPKSPCIRMCTLDDSGCCLGCFRRVEEITAWSSMTAEQQWEVIEAAERRRKAHADLAGQRFDRRDTVEVTERIKQHISSAPAVLFMKGTPDFPQCGFSAQTAAALKACGAKFQHVNIFEDPELREALKKYSNWPTYPQLYVGGELLGGCDIALEMFKSGELKKALEEAGAV